MESVDIQKMRIAYRKMQQEKEFLNERNTKLAAEIAALKAAAAEGASTSERDAEIAALKAENATLRANVQQLCEIIVEKDTAVADAEARVKTAEKLADNAVKNTIEMQACTSQSVHERNMLVFELDRLQKAHAGARVYNNAFDPITPTPVR